MFLVCVLRRCYVRGGGEAPMGREVGFYDVITLEIHHSALLWSDGERTM
jgi:hypothetical protein